MKNKELEKRIHAMAYFSTKWVNRRGNGSCSSNFSTPIIKYIEQLEKQIELKNKSLDNACHFIQEMHKTPDWGGMPQCARCDYLNSPGVCWDCEGNLKKMFEEKGDV